MYFGYHHNIGLDISDHKLRLICLKQRYRKLLLTRFAELDLSPGIVQNGLIINPDALIQALRELPKHGSGARLPMRSVHVGLPEQQTFITTVPLPVFNLEAADKEAKRYLPFKDEEMYSDIQLNRHNQTVSVAASRKDIVNHYLQVLNAANYAITGLHCETEAVSKAMVVSPMDKPAGIIVIDLGTARTTVVFVLRQLIYFTTSYPSVTTGTGLHQDHFTAVIQQINQYYFEHFVNIIPLTKIMLCGSGAAVPNLVEWLHSSTGLQVELGNPTALFKVNHLLNKLPQPMAFTTAIGLALPR